HFRGALQPPRRTRSVRTPRHHSFAPAASADPPQYSPPHTGDPAIRPVSFKISRMGRNIAGIIPPRPSGRNIENIPQDTHLSPIEDHPRLRMPDREPPAQPHRPERPGGPARRGVQRE